MSNKKQNISKQKISDIIICIDLGTYLSSVSIFENGYPKIIPNDFGERFTLSCVSFLNENEHVVGHLAFKNSLESTDYYVSEVKKIIGRDYNEIENEIKSDKTVFPFGIKENKTNNKANVILKVKPSNNNQDKNKKINNLNSSNVQNMAENLQNNFDIKNDLNDYNKKDLTEIEKKNLLNLVVKEYSPEYISSLILAKLKEDVETYLETIDENKENIKYIIKDAIISVPADFKNDQREYTKKAAEMANLNVIRLVNEPTAAALAYMFIEKDNFNNKKCVVYDFGGGTFDVNVISIKVEEGNRTIQILSTGGKINLGGKNFDLKFYDFVCKKLNLNSDKMDFPLRNRLKNACEKAKIELDKVTETRIYLESLDFERNIDFTITRDDYFRECNDLFEESYSITKKAVQDAKLQLTDITDILLVGGVTKVPKIQKDLKNIFPKAVIHNKVDPETAVSMGISVLSALYKGEDLEHETVIFKEVTPISYGIETNPNRKFSVVIPKGTIIPSIIEKKYTNYADNIEKIAINIYEGEDPYCKNNHLLGNFLLEGIPKAPKGKVEMIVSFKVNENAILEVKAREKNGRINKIKIVNRNENILKKNVEKIKSIISDDKNKELKKKLIKYNEELFEIGDENKKFKKYEEIIETISNYLKTIPQSVYEDTVGVGFNRFLLEVQYLFKQISLLLSYDNLITPEIIIKIKNDIFYYLKIIVEYPKTNMFQFIEDLKINKEIYDYCMLFTCREYVIKGKAFLKESLKKDNLKDKRERLILAQNYTREVSVFLKSHNTKETIKNLSEEVTEYYDNIEYDSKFYLDKATIKIFYLDAEIQFEEIYSKDKNSNLNYYEAALENYNKILKIIEIYKDDDYLNKYNKDRIIDESDYLSILFLKRVTIYMKIQSKQISEEEFKKEENELMEKLKTYQNILIEDKINDIRNLFFNEIDKYGKKGNYLNLLKTIIDKYPYLVKENENMLNIDELYKKNKIDCLNKLIKKYYHFKYPKNTIIEQQNYQICIEVEAQLNNLNVLLNS